MAMSWSQSRARARSQSRFQSQSQSRSESRSKSQSWQLGGCQGSRRCRCRSPFPLSSGLLCLYAIVLFILAHCTTVQAGVAQDSVIWIYPEGGEMFYYLDTVNVTYQSSLGDLWLFIICYKDKTVDSLTEIRMQEADPYDGSMLVPMNFTTSTSCWFSLRGSTTDDNGSNSDEWTLADVERSGGPVIIGKDGETSTATATSSGSAAATATGSSSGSSADSNDSLGQGAKIGLGVGIGLGTSALCLGAFWWYHRYLKRKEHEQEMYRKVLGRGDGGGVSPGAYPGTAVFPKHPVDHANDWRHQTQHPVASVAGSSYSMASGLSNDWHSREPSSPYQYYDPIRTAHPAGTGGAGAIPTSVPPSVAAQAVEPRDATHPHLNTTPEPVPDAAVRRSVTEPPYQGSGVEGPTTRSDVAQRRVLSVNYGPAGRLDAGTGADFSLLPDYHSPNGRRPDHTFPSQDLYSPSTPTTPPPPHSAHTRTAAPPIHTAQPSVSSSSAAAPSVAPSELPTAQTHRGFGPDAELPGDGQQPMLRHQRSNLYDNEQKFLMSDIEPLRQTGGPSSET